MKHVMVLLLVVGMMVGGTIGHGRTLRCLDLTHSMAGGWEAALTGPPVQGLRPSSSPGDTMGWTYYDYQHNGTCSKQLVMDDQDGVMFSWMCSTDPAQASRHVHYNYWKADSGFRWPGNPPPGGVQIDAQLRAGYTTCDVLSDGRAVVAFHEQVSSVPNSFYVVVGVELGVGLGIFDVTAVDTFTWVPTQTDSCPWWPHVAVDQNDNIHVVAMNNAGAGIPAGLHYSRSTDQGWTWEPWFTMDTTIQDVAYDCVASDMSNKVGICCTAHREGIDPENISQWSNDVYYWESNNGGSTWDLQKYNVTQWAEDDSMRCYDDCVLIYDRNDEPHFAFTAYKADGDTLIYSWYSMIIHSDFERNKSRVSGWGWPPDSLNGWWFTTADPGAWRVPADRPSLAVDDENNLYCIWVACKDEDMSAGGYPNGEIYVAASKPGAGSGPGAVWGCDGIPDSVWNLTMSETPGAMPGECDDDDYPSVAADVRDGKLRIFYVNDKDAGGIAQEEGTATNNPVIYLVVDAPEGPSGIAEDPGSTREHFTTMLCPPYPNPVASTCGIDYSIASEGSCELTVYDVSGRLVKVLFTGPAEPGRHQAVWDGCDRAGRPVAGGIYFVRLKTASSQASAKVVVLR
jgi:hypothetical protein